MAEALLGGVAAQEAQTRARAEEEGSAHTQWYATAVDLRSSGSGDGGDDVWNFEQLQREKAMLTEEVARLAQTAEAARTEKARLAAIVQEKTKKIAFLYEEKDMLLQHLREALDACSQENAQLRATLKQAEAPRPTAEPAAMTDAITTVPAADGTTAAGETIAAQVMISVPMVTSSLDIPQITSEPSPVDLRATNTVKVVDVVPTIVSKSATTDSTTAVVGSARNVADTQLHGQKSSGGLQVDASAAVGIDRRLQATPLQQTITAPQQPSKTVLGNQQEEPIPEQQHQENTSAPNYHSDGAALTSVSAVTAPLAAAELSQPSTVAALDDNVAIQHHQQQEQARLCTLSDKCEDATAATVSAPIPTRTDQGGVQHIDTNPPKLWDALSSEASDWIQKELELDSNEDAIRMPQVANLIGHTLNGGFSGLFGKPQ
eukprot:COSAG01_NODE_221_length_21422_cov_48.284294_14_plen_432_part_00